MQKRTEKGIKPSTGKRRRSGEIRLGYVRLLDAAPLIMAEELGYFRESGLQISLRREIGWATIRDRLAFGELDISQALGPMPFAMRLGVGVARCNIVTGMVINRNGNAITLSEKLWEEGVQSGSQLRRLVKKGFRQRKLIFGTVSLTSSHYFLLCRWLSENGIDPFHDVIVTILPPEQMVRNMVAGNIDGFCVGEPWNSIAISEGCGWSPVTSNQLRPGYPEKVLIAQERFADYYPEEFAATIAALSRACEYCDAADNHEELLKVISQRQYLDCAIERLRPALSGNFVMGHGKSLIREKFLSFHQHNANQPSVVSGEMILEDMIKYLPQMPGGINIRELTQKTFREDLYLGAIRHQLIST